ncbi:WD repeat-containing protein on Y chromosome-like [Nelusetta ayraudi]|uniref:WD repeat-containing protein on Y chromosome-like n=1 Tax=Nelusetta ayraudi TaxID=303726 RepID=UPI003F6ED430
MAEVTPDKATKVFCTEDMEEISKSFANASPEKNDGLTLEEFCAAMKIVYGDATSEEELTALHMKIDTDCNDSVDLAGLLEYLLGKNCATLNMNYKKQPLPRPFKTRHVDCVRPIVSMLFFPAASVSGAEWDCELREGQLRPYQKGRYLSISSNGIFTFWSDRFKKKCTVDLTRRVDTQFGKIRKVSVSDMLFIQELNQLAISTCDRELTFYEWEEKSESLVDCYALIVEEDKVSSMTYWSDGTKAVFSFGDEGGCLTLFVSHGIKKFGLFSKDVYERISLQKFPTVYVSKLLKNQSKNFMSFKVQLFADICTLIRYLPSRDACVCCGSLAKTMVLATLPKASNAKVTKLVYTNRGCEGFFTSVDYSPLARRMLSGGTDGCLRVWLLTSTQAERELKGHERGVTHVMYNLKHRTFFSVSEDKNLRVWTENAWLCLQNIQVHDMGPAPISCMFYNVYNNELVLANSDIAQCLGQGTDYFKATLPSHEYPLCGTLYHAAFKQAVSICLNGMVKVWDVRTGECVIEFRVTPAEYVGPTAMAFDGPQRRLITISQDGKFRLWNFNSGTKLEVLPLSVHKEVTCILCIDDRTMVSSRDSNIIFDLDMDGKDHLYLKHDYQKDISCMDVHENTLLTASTNGRIVVWDLETVKTLYWLDTTVSPRTRKAFGKHQGQAGNLPVKHCELLKNLSEGPAPPAKADGHVGPLIKSLRSRAAEPDTATLLTFAGGSVCAWSVVKDGGLLGKFRAVEEEDAVITTLCLDAGEGTLLTGDSTGTLYLWDIREFGFRRRKVKGPSENFGGWRVPLTPPPLLMSWRCQQKGVVSVLCEPDSMDVLTAGLDWNLHLWTNTGRLIGLFGRDRWDPVTKKANILLPEAARSPSPVAAAMDLDFFMTEVELDKPRMKKKGKQESESKSDLFKLSKEQLIAYCRKLLKKRGLNPS